MAMDSEDFETADLAIKELDAQERVVDANISAYPHLKQDDAERFMKGLHDLAYPNRETKRTLTLRELKGLGFG